MKDAEIFYNNEFSHYRGEINLQFEFHGKGIYKDFEKVYEG